MFRILKKHTLRYIQIITHYAIIYCNFQTLKIVDKTVTAGCRITNIKKAPQFSIHQLENWGGLF